MAKDQTPGISNDGNTAESRFIELVEESKKNNGDSALGDAIVQVDGLDYYVEVKKCGSSVGKGGTINQVRAIKYIPCVIWA